jgi:hypothetical protein
MKFNQSTESFSHVSGNTNNEETYKSDLKLTLMLSTAIFLMFAPSPDTHDFAQMTANFLISASPEGVLPSSSDD